jgi:hypothetical protein
MRYCVAAVIAALSLSTPCHAQSGMNFVSGFGGNSCGMYLAAVHGHPPGKGRFLNRPEAQFTDEHVRYMDWLDGFFSATNWFIFKEHNQIRDDEAAIDVRIRKWCEQNPTQGLALPLWPLAGLAQDEEPQHTSSEARGEEDWTR